MLEQTKWVVILEILYILFMLAVCFRIIWDTRSVSKSLAYLLLVIFVPVFGVFFYFSIGINYRKRKIYNKKLRADDTFAAETAQLVESSKKAIYSSTNSSIIQNQSLIRLLTNPVSGIYSPILHGNEVELLVNGETFFPKLISALKQAKRHIHIEYYIYEDDRIGNEIKDILIEKANKGVEVRFIYDDFGSRKIRKTIVRELKASGVMVFPFNKIYLMALANRLNYRNHRKIVVIDGELSFTGGINVSDKYINEDPGKLYWRDTHLMIKGRATHSLQQVFLADWNFCSKENLAVDRKFFPHIDLNDENKSSIQVISSGPDSENPSILFAIIQAITLAKEEVLITTPYYIPDDTLQQVLILAALSGVSIKLLVPWKGDSGFVNTVSKAYYYELLKYGVRIFRYRKGFVHAKTLVADRKLASVGTANMDLRSFDLNFEVTAFIYDEKKAGELTEIFYEDLKHSEEISLEMWKNRPKYKKIAERFVRLFSPIM